MDESNKGLLLQKNTEKETAEQPSVQQLDLQLLDKMSFIQSQPVDEAIQITSWNFYSSYIQFFKETTIQSFSIDQILTQPSITSILEGSIKEKLKQNNFIVIKPVQPQNNGQKKFRFHNQIEIRISYSTPSYDVVQVFCQAHCFAKKYTILNQKSQSPRHYNKIIGKGSFGEVFKCECSSENQSFVVKCVKYCNNKTHILKTHIKQFFICDMMSALQIGPRILKTNGFDFIVFQNCMEFEMQKCQPFKKQTLQKDVKQNLLKMHMIQVVHCDLKPQNIMYSRLFNKNIILDYGVAKFISEKWGEKSLSFFQGTYEYCSDEMKELFFRNEITKIDLYKNDICMAEKTFLQSRQINIMKISFMQDNLNEKYSEGSFQYSIKMVPNESAFKFYYFLYTKIELAQSPIKQVEQFLADIDDQKEESKKIKFLLKAIFFASKISTKVYQKLYNQVLSYYSKYKFLKLFYLNAPYEIDELVDYMPYSIKAYEIIKPFSFEKTYFELQDYVHSLLIYKLYFHKSGDFNHMNMARNLQYVLCTPDQLTRFTDEDCFTFYLKYCSFWQPQTQIALKNKEDISSKFIYNIKGKFDIEKSQYLNYKYLPEYDFVKKQCKNIVKMYGFLLSYCMQGNLTKFKQNYAPLVLKNCIILGFQYFRFLPEYVTQYFKKLIEKRSNKLITLCVIEFVEIHFLTKNHFLYTTETKPLYEGKIYEFWSHKVFESLLAFFKQKIGESEPFYSKKKTIKFLFGHILYHVTLQCYRSKIDKGQEDYMGKLKQLISSVQEEFLSQHIGETLKMSQKAMRYIAKDVAFKNGQQSAEAIATNLDILKQISIQVKKSEGLNILPLFCIQPLYHKPIHFKNLAFFDKKINCKQISSLFCMVLRKKQAEVALKKTKVLQMIKFLIEFPGCHSFNYIQTIRIYPVYQALAEMCVTTEEKSQFTSNFMKIWSGLLRIHKRLICIFKDDSSKIQSLNECIIYLNNLKRSNQTLFLEGGIEIAHLLQEIQQPQSHKHYQLLLAGTKLHLYFYNSLNYLKARKQFLSLYLKIKKQKTYCLDQEEYEDVKNMSTILFEEIVLRSTHLFNQILQFWQLKKIKFDLDQEYQLCVELRGLAQIFARKGMIKQMAELLMIYCFQEQTMLGDVYEMKYFCNTYLLMTFNKRIRKPLLDNLLIGINKIKHTYKKLPPKFLMLYVCTLHLDQELSTNFQLWKKLLCEMYDLYRRLLKIKPQSLSQNIIEACEQHLWILSIKYLKFRYVGKRKFMLMVRRMFKSVGIHMNFHKLQKITFFDEFQSYLNFNYSETRQSIIKTEKLTQKMKKYIKICQVPEEFKSQAKKEEFMNEYNLMSVTQQQSDNINRFDLEMMEKYDIKDLTLFTNYGVTSLYFKMRMTKVQEQQMSQARKKSICQNKLKGCGQKNLMSKDKEEKSLTRMKEVKIEDQIKLKVNLIKQSQEYQLCEEAITIIDEIFMIEKEQMLKKLSEKRKQSIIEWAGSNNFF